MGDPDQPISEAHFGAVMRRLGLASSDAVAVAVSGGADSMALALLADGWGERVTALHVDHGLRPGSAAEADQVARWLAARGIPCRILRWRGEKPRTRVQETARTARYRLLEDWCREHGVAALLLAHQADDLAETFLFRLGRGSGLYGLAAMMPSAPPLTPGERLPCRYRPLLDWPKRRLVATCRAAGQAWLEDPGNRDPAYARTRIRALLAAPPLPELGGERLAAVARRLGRARAALEQAVAAHLAAHVRIDARGHAITPRSAFLGAPEEVILRALAQLLTVLGGRLYPPRQNRLEHALDALRAARFRGLSLAGCLIRPHRGGDLLICREPAAIAPPVPLAPGRWQLWDRRFKLRLADEAGGRLVGALGAAGWRALKASHPDLLATAPPHPARLTLPALFAADGTLLGSPCLDWVAKPLPFDVISCIPIRLGAPQGGSALRGRGLAVGGKGLIS